MTEPYTRPRGYCRCRDRRNWDVWVSDRTRAFCRTCGKDLHPNAARRAFAIARAERDRIEEKRAEWAAQLAQPDQPEEAA